MTDTEQLKIWRAEFGRAYTDRNNVDYRGRIPAFKRMVGDLDIRKILEVGCNRGHNLAALAEIREYEELIGIEPSEYAIKQAKPTIRDKISISEGDIFRIPFPDSYFDLVFTSGVLIHIAPTDLPRAIEEIHRVTNRYLLIVEYCAQNETLVHYRGYDNMLWKRDFKHVLLDMKPDLDCVDEGFWSKDGVWDDDNWYLFRKGSGKNPNRIVAKP